MIKYGLAALALLGASNVWADWQLDNDYSRVNFVSVKKNTIGEAHRFKQVKGTLSDKGQLAINIPLASVDTLIPIRDERMQKMLFETKLFPSADLTANVSPKLFNLKVGESKIATIDGDMGLHGVNKLVNVEVMITRVTKDKLQVASLKPIILRAAEFGLEDGIEKLKAVAKLPGITGAVPVSFVLTFKR